MYVKWYTQCFEVQREVTQLAHAIWSVDHATPTIKHAQVNIIKRYAVMSKPNITQRMAPQQQIFY